MGHRNDMNPLQYAERICYSSKESLHFTYEMAIKYKDAPGDYLEAGVAAGGQIIALLYGGEHNKKVYALDSFMGLPHPSNRDNQFPGIRTIDPIEQSALPDPGKSLLESTGAVVVSVDDFMIHMRESGVDYRSLNIIPGWFEVSLLSFECPQLSILRLDSDLYNSTFVCLQHLFERVDHGGVVIIDDIQLPGCKAACDEYFDLINYEPDYKFISNIAYFYK